MFLRVDAHTVRQILHDTRGGSVEARTLFLGGVVGGMVGMRVEKVRPKKTSVQRAGFAPPILYVGIHMYGLCWVLREFAACGTAQRNRVRRMDGA
jgi:hypothetical protein